MGTQKEKSRELKIPYSDLKEEYRIEARERTRERNILEKKRVF